MPCQQFLLDLSGNSGVPSQYRLEKGDIVRMISRQARGIKDLQVTKHFHRGCFSIQTSDPDSAAFLREFQLEITRQGKTHRVGLRPVLPDRPKTRVLWMYTCTGNMSDVPNAYFDKILEDEGFTILSPTEKKHHQEGDGTPVLNGMRSTFTMRGSTHAERFREWESPDGHIFKYQLIYDGQPYQCNRGCGIMHNDGKCPKWEKQQEKKSFAGQQKCYIVGTSLMRHASDTKTVRIDAIPGAKIGHVANHINNDTTIFSQAEVLVIHAGANMDLGSPAISKPFIEDQAAELVKVVKPMVEADKKVFVVDPVAGPLVKESEGGQHFAMVRSRMKKVALEAKAEWVSLEKLDWKPQEDVSEDCTHYTAAGTKKMMTAIAQRIHTVANMDILGDMEFPERPYANIYRNHYKYGCYRCTKEHDRKVACPDIPGAINIAQASPIGNGSTDGQDSFHTLNNSSFNSNNSSTDMPNTLDDLATPAPAPAHLIAPISASIAAAAAAQASTASPQNVRIHSQGKAIDATLQLGDRRDSSSKRGRSSPEASGPNSTKKVKDSASKTNASTGRPQGKKGGK